MGWSWVGAGLGWVELGHKYSHVYLYIDWGWGKTLQNVCKEYNFFMV